MDISERLLKEKEVVKLVSLSRTSLRRMEELGVFPSRRVLGQRRYAWLQSEVLEWIKNLPKVGQRSFEEISGNAAG